MNADGSNQKKVGSYDDTREIINWWFQGGKTLIWNRDGSKIAYATYDKNTLKTDIYTINVGKPSLIPPADEKPMEKQSGIPGDEKVLAKRLCDLYKIEVGEAEAIAICISRDYEFFLTDDKDAREVGELHEHDIEKAVCL